MHTIEVKGQKARVLDEGEGSPVVVLHGWGGRIESMTPVLRCLGAHHRVVAVDLPGFGDSPLPTDTWGTPDYATFIRDLLAERGVRRAHFLGHSFGAKVSFFLATVHPDLVDKLVLVGSPGLRTPPSMAARIKRVAGRGGRLAGKLGPPGAAVQRAIYRRVASSDYQEAGELRPILVKVVNEDFRDVLPLVKSSTLLVWGSDDDAAPLAHGQQMEKLIPDAGLVVFEGAGHFAYLDEPDRFCRVIKHFFGDAGG